MAVTYFQVLKQVKEQIIEYVDLTGVGGIQSVPDEHVKLWLAPLIHLGGEKRTHALTPGILIAPGRTVRADPFQGENCTDDVDLPVSIQIVDREFSVDNENHLHSVLKWEQNIRKHFNNQNLRNEVYDSDGFVDLVYTPSIDIMDERLFGSHHQMVMGITLIAKSRGSRSAFGSI